jgi:hypothetical protein
VAGTGRLFIFGADVKLEEGRDGKVFGIAVRKILFFPISCVIDDVLGS